MKLLNLPPRKLIAGSIEIRLERPRYEGDILATISICGGKLGRRKLVSFERQVLFNDSIVLNIPTSINIRAV